MTSIFRKISNFSSSLQTKIVSIFTTKELSGKQLQLVIYQLKDIYFHFLKALAGGFLPIVKMRTKGKKKKFVIKNSVGIFHINTKDDSMLHSLPTYERKVQKWIRTNMPKELFIDVGSNIGFFSVVAHKSKYKSIMAFEPDPTTFKILRKNFLLNQIDTESAHNVGLGNKKNILSFYSNINYLGGNSFKFKNKESKEIKLEINDLDSYLKKYNRNGEKISLLKMDIEGFELEALQGMTQTLKNTQSGSKIIIEILNRSNSTRKILNILKKNKYVLIDQDKENYLFEKI